ncbi:hypothetical protein IMG5_122020 [Ichthyophthirius multifiliis]|uniref:Uncharacterized protein n=1 Tax=Ichthyophthirius multifiliis TaxID=5932 RepID=G0QV87_ICHMU|nr:hypothetical protein IMG5_122020 [Ichthyophthirius multifiliis]EGR30871.1 hypothetical protein IMG5_122020 [Ichthyophthirius multifiliis]|eukprot:XP_004032458.1 hypothetical protein IMG5_122020 [Ichthyophthirius multifiliis]
MLFLFLLEFLFLLFNFLYFFILVLSLNFQLNLLCLETYVFHIPTKCSCHMIIILSKYYSEIFSTIGIVFITFILYHLLLFLVLLLFIFCIQTIKYAIFQAQLIFLLTSLQGMSFIFSSIHYQTLLIFLFLVFT